MKIVNLTARDWLQRAEQIESAAMTPWPAVSKNIFCSLQWVGKDAVTKTQRQYFGLELENKIITSMEVYFLSPRTIRIRGSFCEPAFRGQNYTRLCLEKVLQQYKLKADYAVTFSTSAALGFYQKIGFEIIPTWEPRPLEFYDFEKKQYVAADQITLLRKRLN